MWGIVSQTCVTSKNRKQIGWLILVILSLSTPVLAETCAKDVEQTLDTMTATDLITICDSGQDPWEIKLKSNERRHAGPFDGTPLSLFDFREPLWTQDDPNKLAIQLVQLTDHVWRVEFVLGGVVQKTDDRQQQFVWARDAMQVPPDRGFLNETDVKYFDCIVLDETRCRTTYNAVICRDYQSDVPHRQGRPRETPGFIVSSKSKLAPVDLLDTFEVVNEKVDALLERVTIHTCRKGWSRQRNP